MFGLTGLAAAVTRAAVDATDYKCAARSKEEGEERFRAIADSAKEAIISADSAGMIIGWNRGAREMFGYEEGEALGKPLTVLIPERYRALHLAGIERFKSTGEARLIGRIVELTGLRRGAWSSQSSFRFPHGSPAAVNNSLRASSAT